MARQTRKLTPTLTEADFDDALRSSAAAKFLGVTTMTMIRWRAGLHGGGPPCLKVGGRFYYPRKYLTSFQVDRDLRIAEKKRTRNERREVTFRDRVQAALRAQQEV